MSEYPSSVEKKRNPSTESVKELTAIALNLESQQQGAEQESERERVSLTGEQLSVLHADLDEVFRLTHGGNRPAPYQVDGVIREKYTSLLSQEQTGVDDNPTTLRAVRGMLLGSMMSENDQAFGMIHNNREAINRVLDEDVEVGARLDEALRRVLLPMRQQDSGELYLQARMMIDNELKMDSTGSAALLMAFSAGALSRFGDSANYGYIERLFIEIRELLEAK